ncbi:hypothetical protein L218DRAFT_1006938 [Marasmius fiardii PR-910]|nr:hypothetical protein L218DRAFT_1006938 [Marasmius fiardii PR-910]
MYSKTKLEPLSKFFDELTGTKSDLKDEEERQEQERKEKEKKEKEKKEKEEKKKAKKKKAESEATGKAREET